MFHSFGTIVCLSTAVVSRVVDSYDDEGILRRTGDFVRVRARCASASAKKKVAAGQSRRTVQVDPRARAVRY